MTSEEADFSKQLVTANPTHTWWYNMAPLIQSLSTAAHLLQSHSELAHYSLFFLDYVGVAVYQYGCALAHFFYSSAADWRHSGVGEVSCWRLQWWLDVVGRVRLVVMVVVVMVVVLVVSLVVVVMMLVVLVLVVDVVVRMEVVVLVCPEIADVDGGCGGIVVVVMVLCGSTLNVFF